MIISVELAGKIGDVQVRFPAQIQLGLQPELQRIILTKDEQLPEVGDVVYPIVSIFLNESFIDIQEPAIRQPFCEVLIEQSTSSDHIPSIDHNRIIVIVRVTHTAETSPHETPGRITRDRSSGIRVGDSAKAVDSHEPPALRASGYGPHEMAGYNRA